MIALKLRATFKCPFCGGIIPNTDLDRRAALRHVPNLLSPTSIREMAGLYLSGFIALRNHRSRCAGFMVYEDFGSEERRSFFGCQFMPSRT